MAYQILYDSLRDLGYRISNTILQNPSQNNNPYLFPIGLAITIGSLIGLGLTIRHIYKNKIRLF